MTIGAGIAILGVWMFAGMMCVSRKISNSGGWVGIICAAIVTYVLI